jgi:hypothetical protein
MQPLWLFSVGAASKHAAYCAKADVPTGVDMTAHIPERPSVWPVDRASMMPPPRDPNDDDDEDEDEGGDDDEEPAVIREPDE